MDVLKLLTRLSLITLIGTLASLGIAAAASIGGLYFFWPMIVP